MLYRVSGSFNSLTALMTVDELAAESESHSDAAAAMQLLSIGPTQRMLSGEAAPLELLPEPAKEGSEPVQLQRTASLIHSSLYPDRWAAASALCATVTHL